MGDPFAWLLTKRAARSTRGDLVKLVKDFADATGEALSTPAAGTWRWARPAYDRASCGFCPYNKVCTAVITGADSDAVIREDFYVSAKKETHPRPSAASPP